MNEIPLTKEGLKQALEGLLCENNGDMVGRLLRQTFGFVEGHELFEIVPENVQVMFRDMRTSILAGFPTENEGT